jgi:multidrug transporter EmrE-like cation transporter
MLYLILAILSSMSISVLMRVSEKYAKNNVTMLAFNYLMCAIVAAFYTKGAAFTTEGIGFAAVIGIISGALYLGSFMVLQWNISKNGVVLPATFMRLGVIVPTVLAVVLFGEKPGVMQIVGVLSAIAAIVIIQYNKGGEKSKATAGLVFLLLCGGITDTTAKIYDHWGNKALESYYLMFTCIIALLTCVGVVIRKKQSDTPADAIFGLLIGIPNYFSARFLLLSLGAVPAVVAYPTYSVGTIVMITLAGLIIFREKLNRQRIIGLGMILCALVLLNM